MKVTLAHWYTDDKGNDHKPGDTITVSAELGAALIDGAIARTADAPEPKPS
jgi:hypothetical protein